MSESAATADLPLEPAQPLNSSSLDWLKFLVCGAAGIGLFATLAVGIPVRWKLLGLFPVFWGVLAGYGLRRWAGSCGVKATGSMTFLTSLLIAMGLTGIVMGGWVQYRSRMREELARVPSPFSLSQAKGMSKNARSLQPSSNDPENASSPALPADVQATFRQRQQELLSLQGYLSRRLPGRPDSPWPELFFAMEVILGTVAGTFVFRGWLETSI